MDGVTNGTVLNEKRFYLLNLNVLQHVIFRFYVFLLLLTPVF